MTCMQQVVTEDNFHACYRLCSVAGRLWLRAMQKFVQLKDDQRTLNSVLDDDSLSFHKEQVALSSSTVTTPEWPCARSERRKYTVCMLPHYVALRACTRAQDTSKIHVFHCHSSKQSSSKEASLRQRKLWRLTASVNPSSLSLGSSAISPDEAKKLFQ